LSNARPTGASVAKAARLRQRGIIGRGRRGGKKKEALGSDTQKPDSNVVVKRHNVIFESKAKRESWVWPPSLLARLAIRRIPIKIVVTGGLCVFSAHKRIFRCYEPGPTGLEKLRLALDTSSQGPFSKRRDTSDIRLDRRATRYLAIREKQQRQRRDAEKAARVEAASVVFRKKVAGDLAANRPSPGLGVLDDLPPIEGKIEALVGPDLAQRYTGTAIGGLLEKEFDRKFLPPPADPWETVVEGGRTRILCRTCRRPKVRCKCPHNV